MRVPCCCREQQMDGCGYRHHHYRLARRASRRADLPYHGGSFSSPGHTSPGRIARRDDLTDVWRSQHRHTMCRRSPIKLRETVQAMTGLHVHDTILRIGAQQEGPETPPSRTSKPSLWAWTSSFCDSTRAKDNEFSLGPSGKPRCAMRGTAPPLVDSRGWWFSGREGDLLKCLKLDRGEPAESALAKHYRGT